MIRNTSPIGWPPLLLFKVIYEGSLIPFIIAGFVVFLPVVGLSICADSFYYGMDSFPVITAYNFVKANLAEGLSLYFGSEHPTFYLFKVMPLFFQAFYPAVLLGFYFYGRDSLSSNVRPYMLYLTASYLLVFSLIAHKETRFLLPVVPFCFLMAGHFLSKLVKRIAKSSMTTRRLVKLYLVVGITVELGMLAFSSTYLFRNWEVFAHLQAKEAAPHSVYCATGLAYPIYTWTHRHKYLDSNGNE